MQAQGVSNLGEGVGARLKLISLLKGPITVIRGSVTDARVNIVKNEEGRVDVLALFEGTPEEPGVDPEEGEGASTEEEPAGGLLLFLKKMIPYHFSSYLTQELNSVRTLTPELPNLTIHK